MENRVEGTRHATHVIIVPVAEDYGFGCREIYAQGLGIALEDHALPGIEEQPVFPGIDPPRQPMFPKNSRTVSCVLSEDGNRGFPDFRKIKECFRRGHKRDTIDQTFTVQGCAVPPNPALLPRKKLSKAKAESGIFSL